MAAEPRLAIDDYKLSYLIYGSETRTYKDHLQSLGCKWNASLKAWVFGKKDTERLQKILEMVSYINQIPIGSIIIKKREPVGESSTSVVTQASHLPWEFGFSEEITPWVMNIHDTNTTDLKQVGTEKIISKRQNGSIIEYSSESGKRYIVIPDGRILEVTSMIGFIPK